MKLVEFPEPGVPAGLGGHCRARTSYVLAQRRRDAEDGDRWVASLHLHAFGKPVPRPAPELRRPSDQGWHHPSRQ
jgi:hypothetical protein